MSNSPILLIGCDDVGCWPCVLRLAHSAALDTLLTPGAVIPPAELEPPLRRRVEEAVANGVRDFVLCGHTDCRALQAALLGDQTELARWLEQAGLTKEALQSRYPGCEGQRLLDVAVQESLLMQAERLLAFPALREAAEAGEVHLELWVLEAETGLVHVFDPASGQFEPQRLKPSGCELQGRHGDPHALAASRPIHA